VLFATKYDLVMTKYICTFGYSHVHPDTGEPLRNKYVIVEAENDIKAHEIMYNRFGQKWAFAYVSKEDAGVERFGLEEIPL
jgi:hypothetical protein